MTAKRVAWGIGLCIVAGLVYCIHLTANYIKMERDFDARSKVVVDATLPNGGTAERGYIYDQRRYDNLRDSEVKLIWFVVVPQTNKHYSCSYVEGAAVFHIGQSVLFFHENSGNEGADGFIIGVFGNQKGKAIKVWQFDMDSAELDLPRD
jgi:hypothetical protein